MTMPHRPVAAQGSEVAEFARIPASGLESRPEFSGILLGDSGAKPQRAGFTLLEVILASVLSLVLLAALYTTLRLHLTMAQRGPEAVQRSQLGRAVLNRVARDIRAIVPPTETSGTQTTGSSEPLSGDPAADLAAEELGTITAGMLGGPDWLMLYITQPLPNLDDAEFASLSGQVAQASNIVRVSYTLTAVATQPDQQGRTIRLGVARSEVASVVADLFDAGSDDSDYRAATQFLSDDVALMQFQYWDDTLGDWIDSWGFDVPIAPPRAIRITLSLQDSQGASALATGAFLAPESTWEPYYSMVVAVPAYRESAEAEAVQ